MIRLQRYLSQCGVASRRKAEELILDGRVRVNGAVVDELGAKVDPATARVTVDGKGVHPQELMYILLNKPKGCVSTVSDPEGRRTVMEYVPRLPVQVAPVGRLDFNSEGVLLLTNDGELAARLLSPQRHIPKTYHVKVSGTVKPAHLRALRQGVRLDDGHVTREAQVDPLTSKSKHDWLVITITEGRNRQVHRMLEALGYRVAKLQRVAFGAITFHGLRVGDARELTQVEVNELRRSVGLAPSTVSRGTWKSRREDTEMARRSRDRQRAEGAPEPKKPPAKPAKRPEPARPGGRRGRPKQRPSAPRKRR